MQDVVLSVEVPSASSQEKHEIRRFGNRIGAERIGAAAIERATL